jgi:hypothetical protein
LGLLLKAVVTAGSVQDRVGAQFLGYALRHWGPELPRLDQVWADGGYRGTFVRWAAERMDWEVQIVPKLSAPGTFTVQPHRWLVEIVQSQMTKAIEGAVTRGREDIANLDLAIRHYDAINEQFDECPTLFEGSLAESSTDLGAEGIQRRQLNAICWCAEASS